VNLSRPINGLGFSEGRYGYLARSKEIGGFFFFFFFFFFKIMYSLLRYKKPRGALAMA